MGDWIRFLSETQRDHYQRRFDNVRALGYQGVQVTTGWQVGGPAAAAANSWTDDAGDAIDHHVYMGGGAGGYYVATGSVSNQSQLSDPGNFLLAVQRIATGSGGSGPYESVFQVEDKPAIMTEWDNGMPNQWRAESAPMFAFYGMGLQGWDGSFNFAGSTAWMETGWPGHGRGPGTWVAETPVYMAQFPAVARAVYKGYIQQGAAAAARRMSVDDLFRGVDPLSQPLADGSFPGTSNLMTPSEVNAIGRVTIKADASLSGSDSTKVDWDTYWDQTNKIITSTTGQLVWDYNNKVVQVKAPSTQGLIGWAGGRGTYNLGDLQVNVNSATPFCSLLFTPLDGQPLATSDHILVTALAQDKQMGTVYGSGGNTLTTLGGPPLLLQPVQAAVTVVGGAVDSVDVVDIYGVPTGATVPVTSNSFTINGDYTTVYYQINRAPSGTPTIALSTSALTPTCAQGTSPADGSFQVWNTSSLPLNYTVSDDVDWLSVSPAGGTSADATDKQTHTVTYSASGLAPGTYTGHITVSDPAASNDPQTIDVTLTVHAPAVIGLSTTTLSPSCLEGSSPADDSFMVWDGGEAALNYTVTDDVAWLSVSPPGATSTSSSDRHTETVSYSADALAPGTYTGHITVTSADANNSPQTVTVTLSVLVRPSIVLDKTVLDRTITAGQNASDDTFQVWDGGGAALNYTVGVDQGWLSVAPTSGTSTGSGDKQTETVTYTTAGLSPGTHTAHITVTDAAASNSPQTITVSVTVQAPPAIALSTTSLTPVCTQGTSPADDSFQVWDAGELPLSYTVADDAAWLSVAPASGASTGSGDKQTHVVSYSAAALGAGTYTGHITVADASASNSPQTITVTLTVQAVPAIGLDKTTLSPTVLEGADAAGDSFQVRDTGGAPLNYTVTDDVDWLSVSPTSGTSASSTDVQTEIVTYTTSSMAAGTYTGHITVSDPAALNDPQTITVTLTVQTPSGVAVDKTTLSPTATVGQDAPDDTFQVWDSGDEPLSYQILDDQSWLSVTPTTGNSTGSTDKQTETVTYSTSGMSAGTYTGHIYVLNTGGGGSQTITVTLSIGTPPAIALDKATLSPTAAVGQDATDDSFQVWDSGGGTLSYTVGDDAAWLSVAPTSGTSTGSTDKQSHTVSYDTSALSAGTYTGHITVTDAAASNSPQTITVTLDVTTAPAIALSTASLSPTTTVGQNAPDDSFQVWDSGGGTLSYTVGDDAAWLSVAPTSGTSTGSTDKQSHTVSYDTSALSAGTYTGHITVTDASASNSPQTITVSLTVQTAAAIALDKTALSPTVTVGSDAADDGFQVWDTGDTTLNYTVGDDASWLSVTPASGTSTGSGDKQSHTVSYDTSALAAGTYTGHITVTDASASNSPQTITVSLTVQTAAAIALDKTALSPTVTVGNDAADDTFQVWDTGDVTLNYTVSDDASWLSVAPASGTSTGTSDKKSHTVTYDTSGLAAGAYTGHITVTDASASNSPQTITVSLTVQTGPAIALDKTTLSPTVTVGGDAAGDSFQVWDTGETTLNYTVGDDVSWLSVAPTSGTSTGSTDKQSHTVSYDTSSLAAGAYTGHITVTDASASNSPQTITVSLTVRTAPAIALDKTALSPTVTVGNDAADDTFQVWDTGETTLDYSVADDSTWLSVTPASGSSTGTGDKQSHTVTYNTSALTAGTYTGHITVTDAAASNSPQTITVSLTVQTAAAIALDKTTLTPTVSVGQDAADDSFQVWDTGDVALNYTVTDDVSWLSVAPSSGSSTGSGDKQSHTVTYNTSALSAGTYTGHITVTDASASNSPQTITVNLTVQTAPAIALDKATLTPTVTVGNDAADDSFQVWDTGDVPLDYTVADDAVWLSVSPASGTSTGSTDKQSHTVSYDTAGLSAGTYTGHITVSDASASNSPQAITVSLTVQTAAAIALDKTTLTPTVTVGSDAADGTFQVWDTGDLPLNYTVADDASWLSVAPTSGTSTGTGDKQTHTVSYDTSGLAAGTYTGHITVTDASASNSPQTITVSLTVQTGPAIALDKAALSPTVTVGNDAADDSFQVWDTGDVALNYTVADDAPWLSVAPPSGSSAGTSDKQSHTVSYTTSGLAAGTYTGHITVTDAAATNSPQTITVSLTVQTAPAIALDTAALSPTVTVGQNAADDTFQVWDTGDLPLNYTVNDDVAWLSVAPGSGTSTGAGDKQSHTVTYDTSSLAAGTYTGHITVTDASASNSPQTITVSLTVQTAPAIALDKTAISPTVTVGSDAADDTFQVWDTGDVPLGYTVADDVAWLSVTPPSGSSTGSADKQTHTVSYDTSGLAAGTYTGHITVTDASASNSPQAITVNLTVQTGPAIALDKTALSPTVTVGQNAADDTFQVWDTGEVALDYTVSDDAGWLSVSPNSGTSSGTGDKQSHTVSYDTSALAAGTYTGHITVTDAAASNSPQTITVSLTVQTPAAIALDKTALSPTATVGHDAADDTFQVWDTGDLPLSYTVSDDATWLSVAPGSGTSTGTDDKQSHTVSYSTSGLAAGTYTGHITVADASASNTPQTITVSLTVQTGPAIALDKATLSPTVTVGQDAADDTFQVWDTGDVALDYTVSDDAAWLSVAPTSGTSTGTGDKQSHTVSYDTSALAAGTYTGHIAVTAPSGTNSPQTITVTLTVQTAAAIALDKTTLSPTVTVGSDAPDDTFQVWDTGDVALNYSVSDDAAWLSVAPTSGTSTGTGDKQSHTVSYDTSALAAGTYTGHITVADAAASNSPQTITVSLTVQTGPAIALDKTTLSPTVTVGQDAADDTFQVWDTGDVALDYTVSDDAAWLSVAPTSGTSTGTGDKQSHTVSYDTSALAAGTYTGHITVADAAASNSPQTIAVSLTVQTAGGIALDKTTLSPTVTVGNDAADDTFQVWDTGDVALAYTVSDDVAWLSVAPASGTSTGSTDKQSHTVSYDTSALAAGTYTGHISVTDASATNSPQTITVSLTVQTAAGIALDKTTMSPTVTVGNDAADGSFQVWDTGDVALNYSVSDDATWLSVTPTSGSSTGTSDKQSHTVSYSTSGLAAGTYTGHINVADAGASNSPQTITVSLTVQTAAGIALDKTTMSPTVTVGNDAADGSFQVWDTGDVALNYSVSDDATWLSVTPTSGSSTGTSDKQSHTVSYSTSGLAAGTYTGHINVADAGASNSPQTITISLTVQTAAGIALDKTTLSPTATVGSDATDDTFQVWDTGDTALDYTVTDDVGWLSVAPASGSSTGATDKQSHTVSYSTSGLGAGTYTGHISVTDDSAGNSPQTITVSLTVQTAAGIALDKTTLNPAVTVGNDAADDSFQVWDTGDVALSYTVSDDVSWLSVNPASGSSTGTGDKQSHTVSYYTSGLAAGTYTGHISVTDASASNSPQTIIVSLTVTALPSIGTATTSLSPACAPGGNPASDQIQVWNAGGGTLDYSISDDAAWLSVTPPSGSSTGSGDLTVHTVTYSASGLAAGTYNATITVAAPGADNTPLAIPVRLTVGTNPGPTIHITYPTAADSPLSDSMVTVTGTASDADGVQAIWVNGVQAINTGTGFSTWAATIPLNQGFDASDPNGINVITASGADILGNYTANGDSVTVDSIGGGGLVQMVSLNFQATGSLVPGDVDTYQFEAVVGTSLTVKVNGKGNPKAEPRVELYGVDGQSLATDAGYKTTIKQVLPDSGLYTVRVSLAGDAGQYSITISGREPRSKMKQNAVLATGASVNDYYMTVPRSTA